MRHVELKTYRFHDAVHWRLGLLRGFTLGDEGHGLESTSLHDDSAPTCITPLLISPDGVVRGWARAEIDAVLADGAELVVDAAWDVDARLEESIRRFPSDTAAGCWNLDQLMETIEEAIPWDEGMTRRYAAGDWPAGRPLPFPLHEIDSTRLWLRLQIRGGDAPSRIRALRVLYPNLSLGRYLPAVYHEDARSQPFVRGVMAIFESLFGGLENDLAALPRNIDPRTAPDDWLPFLISWLGLPRAVELSAENRRTLLQAAPSLLRRRGTAGALLDLLRILVGNDFDVVDHGADAAPWVLPSPGRLDRGSRLGRDTLVLRPVCRGPRLGDDFRLGEVELGVIPTTPEDLFARRAGAIDVLVALPTEGRLRLEPLLRRYLDLFVPAHCRYTLRFVPHDELSPPQMLDEHTRLYPEVLPRLGESARLGRLRLSDDPGGDSWVLGDGVRLNCGVTLPG